MLKYFCKKCVHVIWWICQKLNWTDHQKSSSSAPLDGQIVISIQELVGLQPNYIVHFKFWKQRDILFISTILFVFKFLAYQAKSTALITIFVLFFVKLIHFFWKYALFATTIFVRRCDDIFLVKLNEFCKILICNYI